MALYLIPSVNLGIVSNWALMSPVGLAEALGGSPVIFDREDHETLKTVLAGLKSSLDAAGIKTNVWSIPLKRFKNYPPGREASEILRTEIAPELRRIPDAVFIAAADQTTILLRAGFDVYSDASMSTRQVAAKHPSDFRFQAWVNRMTGEYAGAADDYGVIADGWRRRGNTKKAVKAYRLEGGASLKAAREFLDEATYDTLEAARYYVMKAVVAYEQTGESEKVGEALRLREEIEQKLASFVAQEKKSGFMGRMVERLERGIASYLSNMGPMSRDAAEMAFYRKMDEEKRSGGNKEGPKKSEPPRRANPFGLRIVK